MLVAIAQLEKNRLFLTGAHTDEVMACIRYGEELLTGSNDRNAIVLFYETIVRNEDNLPPSVVVVVLYSIRIVHILRFCSYGSLSIF